MIFSCEGFAYSAASCFRDENMYKTIPHDGPAPMPLAKDPRWAVLDLVQTARETLGLKDRDITVLRGLLSLIKPENWQSGQGMKVFASNKVLSERCDGIHERTLRRHLAKLCESGLITRNSSANRKRYILRNSEGQVLEAFGFDLNPLRLAFDQLTKLSEMAKATAQEITILRKVLRHKIWCLEEAGITVDPDYLRLLRQKTNPQTLASAIDALSAELPSQEVVDQPLSFETVILSDSDSKNDRHIHSSNKEYYMNKDQRLDLEDCLEKAPTAVEYMPSKVKTWHELNSFAKIIGPALSIKNDHIQQAEQLIGSSNVSLIILGLLEAGSRIARPACYFSSLVKKASNNELSIVKMYRSLTRKHRFPAGNPKALC